MPWKLLADYRFDLTGTQDLSANGLDLELKNGAVIQDSGLHLDGEGAHGVIPVPAGSIPSVRVWIGFSGVFDDDFTWPYARPLVVDPGALNLGTNGARVFCNYVDDDTGLFQSEARADLAAGPEPPQIAPHKAMVEVHDGTIKIWPDDAQGVSYAPFSDEIPAGVSDGIGVGGHVTSKYFYRGTIQSLTVEVFDRESIPTTMGTGHLSPRRRRNLEEEFQRTLSDPRVEHFVRQSMIEASYGLRPDEVMGDLTQLQSHVATLQKGLQSQTVSQSFIDSVEIIVEALFTGTEPRARHRLARSILPRRLPRVLKTGAQRILRHFPASRHFMDALRERAEAELSSLSRARSS